MVSFNGLAKATIFASPTRGDVGDRQLLGKPAFQAASVAVSSVSPGRRRRQVASMWRRGWRSAKFIIRTADGKTYARDQATTRTPANRGRRPARARPAARRADRDQRLRSRA